MWNISKYTCTTISEQTESYEGFTFTILTAPRQGKRPYLHKSAHVHTYSEKVLTERRGTSNDSNLLVWTTSPQWQLYRKESTKALTLTSNQQLPFQSRGKSLAGWSSLHLPSYPLRDDPQSPVYGSETKSKITVSQCHISTATTQKSTNNTWADLRKGVTSHMAYIFNRHHHRWTGSTWDKLR